MRWDPGSCASTPETRRVLRLASAVGGYRSSFSASLMPWLLVRSSGVTQSGQTRSLLPSLPRTCRRWSPPMGLGVRSGCSTRPWRRPLLLSRVAACQRRSPEASVGNARSHSAAPTQVAASCTRRCHLGPGAGGGRSCRSVRCVLLLRAAAGVAWVEAPGSRDMVRAPTRPRGRNADRMGVRPNRIRRAGPRAEAPGSRGELTQFGPLSRGERSDRAGTAEHLVDHRAGEKPRPNVGSA